MKEIKHFNYHYDHYNSFYIIISGDEKIMVWNGVQTSIKPKYEVDAYRVIRLLTNIVWCKISPEIIKLLSWIYIQPNGWQKSNKNVWIFFSFRNLFDRLIKIENFVFRNYDYMQFYHYHGEAYVLKFLPR